MLPNKELMSVSDGSDAIDREPTITTSPVPEMYLASRSEEPSRIRDIPRILDCPIDIFRHGGGPSLRLAPRPVARLAPVGTKKFRSDIPMILIGPTAALSPIGRHSTAEKAERLKVLLGASEVINYTETARIGDVKARELTDAAASIASSRSVGRERSRNR